MKHRHICRQNTDTHTIKTLKKDKVECDRERQLTLASGFHNHIYLYTNSDTLSYSLNSVQHVVEVLFLALLDLYEGALPSQNCTSSNTEM